MHSDIINKCTLADWKKQAEAYTRMQAEEQTAPLVPEVTPQPVSHSAPTPTWTWKCRLKVRMGRAAWIHLRWDIQADLAWGHRRKEPINHTAIEVSLPFTNTIEVMKVFCILICVWQIPYLLLGRGGNHQIEFWEDVSALNNPTSSNERIQIIRNALCVKVKWSNWESWHINMMLSHYGSNTGFMERYEHPLLNMNLIHHPSCGAVEKLWVNGSTPWKWSHLLLLNQFPPTAPNGV